MSVLRQRRGGAAGAGAGAGATPAAAAGAETKGKAPIKVGGVNVYKALGIIMLVGLVGTITRYYREKDPTQRHLVWERIHEDAGTGFLVYFWDRSGAFSAKEQISAIIDKGEPMVIINAPTDTWKAVPKWTSTYIAETVPELKGVRSKKTSDVFYNENLNSMAKAALEVDIGHAPTEETLESMATQDFFARTASNGEDGSASTSYEYFADNLFEPELEALRLDLASSNESAPAAESGVEVFTSAKRHENAYLWLARSRIKAALHYDTANNFNVQVMGRKQFSVAPPAQWYNAEIYPSFHVSARQSRLPAPWKPVFGKRNVTLMPGQVLYIPAYHLHTAESVTDTANVNFFSRSRLRIGHKFWLQEERIMPKPLRDLVVHHPSEYPNMVAIFVLGFSVAVKNHACASRTDKKYDLESIKPHIAEILERRFSHDWDAYGCGDWKASQCPDLSQTVEGMPEPIRKSFGDIFADNLKVFKHEPCEQLHPVLDMFLADWWEATVAAAVGFDKMCLFLRCLTLPAKNP
ncbi:Lysine-specific demethylase 8 [Hondaea fermentalgiana]|uniref:Lysine-specific demethylase 8 n=1 Tax=Hondaea fermentalgiana TaxID=2315210 RepID=A0A2R5GMB6_9STRA|nr:Lysine-specific demethylase 8 [Hondaea fermentalgiana]|eukprot:GBG29014.1 Lysine-specific demethylase 8 [Hondaea fermentalgiana]